jgi:hypothetical protein
MNTGWECDEGRGARLVPPLDAHHGPATDGYAPPAFGKNSCWPSML